ncbi:MAG: hypothetical protein S4CHLAM2_17300 [Chlamydiales bacterium]|nr:hypothetical protein [Chlamydiales bacterium]
MNAKEAQKIVAAVQKIVTEIAPNAKNKTMYGGLVYELDYTNPRRLFCGIFVRKEYVTIEFDRGTELKDDKKLLKGCGKHRRHLTLHSFAEVKTKQTENFIKQSFQLSA